MDAECSEQSHQREVLRLETLQKTLNDLYSDLVKQSVRCHLLQVDLATQVSPHTVQAVNSAAEDCSRCYATLGLLPGGVDTMSNTLDNIPTQEAS